MISHPVVRKGCDAPSPSCREQKHKSPGGHWQWRQAKEDPAPVMMLTSDVSLLEDDSYLALVKEFAANQTQLEVDFANGKGALAPLKCHLVLLRRPSALSCSPPPPGFA